jgi:hypothetical protein
LPRVLVWALPFALALPQPAAGLDLGIWARLLAEHTREVPDIAGTRVDYTALRGSAAWPRLLESLDRADPAALASTPERLAFWINAYNVLAIDVVLRHYPLASIRDAGSLLRPVWKRAAGRVGGKARSLDEIEHAILRPLGDPRIHGAIVCASLSCPPLLREPYRSESLDAQLDANVRRWLADPRKGVRVDPAADRLELSPIFDWFEEDFAAAGGVLAFVERFAPVSVAEWLRARGGDVELRSLEYDWHLNDLRAR